MIADRTERNLWIISSETKGEWSPRRYVVKPFADREKSWGVWDQKGNRYLKDREVAALTSVEVRELLA